MLLQFVALTSQNNTFILDQLPLFFVHLSLIFHHVCGRMSCFAAPPQCLCGTVRLNPGRYTDALADQKV